MGRKAQESNTVAASADSDVARLLGRVSVQQKVGRCVGALRDAEAAVALKPAGTLEAEALRTRGNAQRTLSLYHPAAASFQAASDVFRREGDKASAKACDGAADEAKQRAREQEEGAYAWADLYAEPRPDQGSQLELAAFCSRCVKLGHSKSAGPPAKSGRCVVVDAGKELAEGDLVLACPSFVLTASDELREAVLGKLRSCTRADFERFFCLFDGSNADEAVPAAVNMEARPSDTIPGSENDSSSRDVDKAQVDRILKYNTRAWDVVNEHGAADEASRCGVWFLSSFLNHSCRPNVQETFAGDGLLLCRAAGSLPSGAQLLSCYVSPLQPLHVRRERLSADFGFECCCGRCKLEEALLPKDFAARTLDKLNDIVDKVKTNGLRSCAESFDAMIKDVEREVLRAVESSARRCDQEKALRAACIELWGSNADCHASGQLVNLLCGSFLPIFKGAAFAWKQLGDHARACAAYGRCVELLREVAPGSAYMAHWAAEQALQAQHAKSEHVASIAQNAWRWNQVCHGSPQAVKILLERHGWTAELIQLGEKQKVAPAAGVKSPVVSGASTPPPRENDPNMSINTTSCDAAENDSASWECSLTESDGVVVLSIVVPDCLEASDLDLDVCANIVVVAVAPDVPESSRRKPLEVPLPQSVNVEAAPPAKYKKKTRRLILELPLK